MNLSIRHKLALLVLAIVAVISLVVYVYLLMGTGTVSHSLKTSLVTAFLLALILAVPLSFAAAALVFRPFQGLFAWAKSVMAGDFSKKIFIPARDELGELARAINAISQQINSRKEESATGQSRLEAVFLSMFNGVMILDHRGAIILMNAPLREFLSVDQQVIGKRPLEVIRNIVIQEMADNVLNFKNRFESGEIIVMLAEEKILQVHATPIMRENRVDGAVLIFHDITELRKLENIRQDFVANVSHELRTPVSTIRGYAETLLEGALEDKEHAREFLRIIHDDAERLSKLIDDLLDLSRIESGKLKLTFEERALELVVDRVLTALKSQAQKNAIRLVKEIPRDLPRTRIDEDGIAQVMRNLVENAIKYNNKGGCVTVCARATDGGYIEVSVIDTGIGIPHEDLPRIFERFYRVDKARSRELGSTGLGLSIVKHIIQAHRGEVTVESQLGRGSTFRFTLPQV